MILSLILSIVVAGGGISRLSVMAVDVCGSVRFGLILLVGEVFGYVDA